MKAAFLKGPHCISVDDVAVPKIRLKEILVEMKACGVCGTDIEKVHGKFITPPKLGHEVTGKVAEIGEKVDGIRVGDRVFVHHHVPCYNCHYCRHGDYTMCKEYSETNLDPCGMAECFRVPETNISRGAVLPLSDHITYEVGTLIEPIACCLRGLNKTKLEVGDDVLVIGAGPIGLTMVNLLKLRSTRTITVSEILDFRKKAAKDFGADHTVNPKEEDLHTIIMEITNKRGVDLVIVAVGGSEVILQGLGCVRKGGQILLFGAPPKGDIISYDVSRTFINEVSLIPTYSTTEIETTAALRLLEKNRLSVQKLITHTFPIDEALKAIDFASKGKNTLKVIIKP